jgi:preprotein translocase subunit YajC
MTAGGWAFMLASWALILAVFAFAMSRALRKRP